MQRIDAALQRGAEYLISKQDKDGSFRSGSYAAFRDGYSLSPLVLLALSMAPPSPTVKAAYDRGLGFVATVVDASGKMRTDAAKPQYPSYSAALSVLALNPSAAHKTQRDALLAEVRALQLDQSRSFKPGDENYGGWGYEITTPPTANLSATLFAIGALTLAGVPASDPDLLNAKRYVERCQNTPGDGGFFFAPGQSDGNKAGFAGKKTRSYGSMTADGVRALLRLGVPPDDPRVKSAHGWLLVHFDATRNPGEFPAPAEIRRVSSYYYYAWSVAHAMRALGETDFGKPLAETLLSRQAIDGSWKNPASEMRENEPLVATSFAMAALAVCRIALSGEHRSHAGVPISLPANVQK